MPAIAPALRLVPLLPGDGAAGAAVPVDPAAAEDGCCCCCGGGGEADGGGGGWKLGAPRLTESTGTPAIATAC
jgi:hypothetical protein